MAGSCRLTQPLEKKSKASRIWVRNYGNTTMRSKFIMTFLVNRAPYKHMKTCAISFFTHIRDPYPRVCLSWVEVSDSAQIVLLDSRLISQFSAYQSTEYIVQNISYPNSQKPNSITVHISNNEAQIGRWELKELDVGTNLHYNRRRYDRLCRQRR